MVEGTVCIILAGGSGQRMATSRHHKTCFAVAGRPAIVRALDTYKAAGLQRFMVVVGDQASKVIATVASEHPEVSFVYQTKPLGTGHAAMVAAEALQTQEFHGNAMVVAGDKFTRPAVVQSLLDQFTKTQPDALLTAIPQTGEGRIITNKSGHLLGIIERADLEAAERSGQHISLNGHRLTPTQIRKRGQTTNGSMYLFRFDALVESLKHIESNNAQGEFYLTDAALWLAEHGSVQTMLIPNAEDLMGFNTPDELLAIEQSVRRRDFFNSFKNNNI